MTEEAWLSLIRQAWLVMAVALFLGILWRVLRPGTRAEMERNARIPFNDELRLEDRHHGDA